MSPVVKIPATKRARFWTHPSVTALAEEGDPVERIIARASAVALDAMQAGWSGPPFDPFKLADHLKIAIVPREDITDARIVQAPDGRFQIEFNPTRPRGRVRYSIAHDLAHTLFSDCGEVARHRLARDQQKDDDWQLEMLCNIGAAEFLMPVGSFPDLKEQSADIDHLLTLRGSFDVSMEALLLRVARLTEQPCGMFAASRKEMGEAAGRYQIDYTVFSRSWAHKLNAGTVLPNNTMLAECTAIGFTAKRNEQWPDPLGHVHVECVGIPPYPSKRYPRVVGMILPLAGQRTEAARLTLLKGDATEPRGEGPRIIAHVVNDKAALWGAGFGRAVREKWPHVQNTFRDWATKHPQLFRLGNVFMSLIDDQTTAFQMICQHGYGPSEKPRIRYSALQSCLNRLAQEAIDTRATIHMPRIGAGQAGGAWRLIQQLIDEILCGHGLDVTIYELPDAPVAVRPRQGGLFDA